MSGTKKINKALLTFTKVLDVLDIGIADIAVEQENTLASIKRLELHNNNLCTTRVNAETVSTNLKKLLNVKGD